MARLKDKVAIVTGGARGIGAAFARAMAAEGAALVIADILDGGPVAAEISATGAAAIFVETDISSPAACGALAAAAERRFGRIDILVNNAAMLATLAHRSFAEIDDAEWDKVMAVNLRGAFDCAKAVLPAMRRQGRGRIINMASGTVFKGTPLLLHYVTSKGAILAMTRALARELGPENILVNAIAPGLTLSDGVKANRTYTRQMFEANLASRALKREEEPQDLVGALLFLASADSDFMTGQVLVVDGGSVTH